MRTLILAVGLLAGNFIFSQSPDAFSYQAVARNTFGDALNRHSSSIDRQN